eukprot:g567.t1
MKNYALTIEYKHLHQRAPGGVYVLPSYDNIRTWRGVIFLRQGPYRDGVFKFKIFIPEDYPADGARPRVVFSTNVFHPLVDPSTNELDLSKRFPKWIDGRDYLIHLLTYVKKIFYLKTYNIKGAVNKIAADMFKRSNEERSEFMSRVNRCVQVSLSTIYENDEDSPLSFSKSNPLHKRYYEALTRREREGASRQEKGGVSVSFDGVEKSKSSKAETPDAASAITPKKGDREA